MFDFDDDFDLDDPKYTPSISINIHRPGQDTSEYTVLTLKGDSVDSLYDVLEFFTRGMNAAGFTYVDSLRVGDPF